jgi:outer membrane protein TolC
MALSLVKPALGASHASASNAAVSLRRLAGLAIEILAALALTLLFSAQAFGEQIGLGQAVELALKHNPDLAAEAEELNVARAEVVRADYVSQFNQARESAVERTRSAGPFRV